MRCTQATRHHTLSIRTGILKKEEEKKKTYKKVVEEEMTCRSNIIKHACYTQMRSLASCVSKSCRADTQPTGHRASHGYASGQSVVGGQAGPWR